MNVRAGRSSVLAGVVAVTLLAIGGCGGASSRPRAKHAVFVPPGLVAGSARSGGSQAPSSGAAAPDLGPAPTASSGGTTVTVSGVSAAAAASAGATGIAGVSAGPPPVAKVTFAAPGGESQAGFVASADAICRSFRRTARAIGATATTLPAQEAELGHLVTATEQAVKALTDLSPPVADARGLRHFADTTVASVIDFAQAQSRTRSTSEAIGSAVEARDFADSGRSARDAAAAQGAARRLGLHVCGSPGSAWL